MQQCGAPSRRAISRPIPCPTMSQLHRILDNARFAPSGGNRQGWHVIVVRDEAKRAALGPLIEPTYRRYLAEAKAGSNPWNTIEPAQIDQATVDATPIPPGFIDRLIGAPVILLVTVDLSVVAAMDQHLPRIGVIPGASIYPFVWNILLAARNEGLGGTLTTFVVAQEAEVKALFGIPDRHAVAAMLPIGKRQATYAVETQPGDQATYAVETQPGAGNLFAIRHGGRVRRRRLRRVSVGMSGSRTRLPAPSHPMMQGSPTD